MIAGLSEEQRKFLLRTIHGYFPDAEILVFGSRLTGKNKPASDLDLCLKSASALELAKWGRLEEEISGSDIPFKVDLVDWHRISEEFRGIIVSSSRGL
ncbi:MAG: nucleotidyltransferase domain-containing protein [Deltaproteobacteria bacterium]|nr:nucleotidyltransferase domain-containing protein [Deltaproteobacteria bacterium]